MTEETKATSKALERSRIQTYSPKIEAVSPSSDRRPSDTQEQQQSGKFVKPKIIKPLQVLSSATNATGEVFNPGDKILVSSPWGGKAIAEIVNFYRDDNGDAWARYTPQESRPDWPWEGGCLLAARLLKA
jgi:hypothetical protein